jgi:general secretion pathway protein G
MSEKRDEGGFTLIELLIVIIILAILAAIVVFAVGTTGANAKTAACNSDAKTMETALESYKAEVGYYPGDVNLQVSGQINPLPVINQGQQWANAIPPTNTPPPGPWNPAGAVYGLLGNNGVSASDTSVATPPLANTTTAPPPVPANSPAGSWLAPNGTVVGPFMRALPNSTHYQIWTDGQGGVFVFPPATAGGTPAYVAAHMDPAHNFDITPAICQTAPV